MGKRERRGKAERQISEKLERTKDIVPEKLCEQSKESREKLKRLESKSMQGELGEETRGATERMLRRGRQRGEQSWAFRKISNNCKEQKERRRRKRRSGGRATETRKNSPGTGNEWKLSGEWSRKGGEKKRRGKKKRGEGNAYGRGGGDRVGRGGRLGRMIIHHHVRLWSLSRARPMHAPHYKLIVGVRDNHGR